MEEAYQRLHSIDCGTDVNTGQSCHDGRFYLLKNSLGVPLHRFLHMHSCCGLRPPLTGCHHDQRLSYGRVSLGVVVGSRDWWSDRMCMVVDLTWLLKRRMLAWKTRPVRTLIAQGTGLCMYLRASKWETWFQLKWLCDIRREGLAEVVHLHLHLWHGPIRRACLQYSHLPDEEFSCVRVQLRIRACNGHLDTLDISWQGADCGCLQGAA